VCTVTRTYLVDDLDGSTEAVTTVQFNADGTNLEVDLSAPNAARLREKLARFVDAATPVKPPKAAPKRAAKSAVVKTNRQHVQEIRSWAQAAGLGVSSRGRVAKAVQDAFDAAH